MDAGGRIPGLGNKRETSSDKPLIFPGCEGHDGLAIRWLPSSRRFRALTSHAQIPEEHH